MPHAGPSWLALAEGHRFRPDDPDFVALTGAGEIMTAAPAPLRASYLYAVGKAWERATITVEPRSVYVLQGPARHEWQHSLPPGEALRYSVTFRTLAKR